MNDHQNPLDPIELALQNLKSAEQAHLFDRTKINARDMLQSGNDLSPTMRRIRMGMITSAAAAVILAIGVGSYLFSTEIDSLRDQRRIATRTVSTNAHSSDCDGDFFECVTGPSQFVMVECNRFDYDLDGDVDMSDFSTYQLSCDGITR